MYDSMNKDKVKRTSREANKEAIPIGTKIMLTSINAEITCIEVFKVYYFLSHQFSNKIDTEMRTNYRRLPNVV